MSNYIKLNNNQAGSTIVEILVALAISGAVISAALVSVNRSTQSLRQFQERSEAVKIAESQIESVRSRFSSENQDVVDEIKGAAGFCITDDGSVFDFGIFTIVDFNDPVANVLSNLAGFPAECVLGDRYGTHMTYDNSTNRLTVDVRWQRAGGGVDQVRMIYGLHEVIDD